jgi:hypothetical protein
MMRTWMPTLTLTFGAALSGCNSQPQSNATDRGHADAHADSQPTGSTPNPRVRLERPSVSMVKYDADSATISLYELPDQGARWMVSTPTEPNGVPVPRVYKFKGKLDPRQVSLFFTVPSGGVSGHVSLQEILDAQKGAAH